MDTVYTDIYLDVFDVDKEPPVVKAVRDDTNSRVVRAYLTKRGENYSIGTDDTVTLWSKKPDGTVVSGLGEYFTIDEVSEDNPSGRYGAEIVLNTTQTDTVGDIECQFRIEYQVQGGELSDVRTQKFILRVYENFDHDYLSAGQL